MTRRCSHCSNNGHNSRTCPARGVGVRLFGVRLTDGAGAMKKSASMGCLPSSVASTSPAAAAASPSGDTLGDVHRHHSAAVAASGYASDDPARASCSSNCPNERKKGVPWTEDEHRMFLMGLQKLGKGDWRGIARNFVVSRTSTQVASHAQKYFIRQSNASRRKRRSSLFDMVPEMAIDQVIPNHEEQFLPHSPNQQGHGPTESSTTMKHAAELRESCLEHQNSTSMLPGFYYPTFMPVHFWPSNMTGTAEEEAMTESAHEIIRPTPIVLKEAVNMDEVVCMSKLSIGEAAASHIESTALSLKLMGSSVSSKSAFRVNPPIAVPDLNQSSSSPIHAV